MITFSHKREEKEKIPIHGMVADFIMTETTSEEFVTTSGQKLTVSFVVLTPKHLFLSISKRWRAPRYTVSTSIALFGFSFRHFLLSSYPSTA